MRGKFAAIDTVENNFPRQSRQLFWSIGITRYETKQWILIMDPKMDSPHRFSDADKLFQKALHYQLEIQKIHLSL